MAHSIPSVVVRDGLPNLTSICMTSTRGNASVRRNGLAIRGIVRMLIKLAKEWRAAACRRRPPFTLGR
jgi:hypothetical protein